jgi:hypothetical protein
LFVSVFLAPKTVLWDSALYKSHWIGLDIILQVLTRDSVTVAVDAVVYYRVQNATWSVNNVENAARSTQLLAQTTLRNVLGTKNLAEILSDRENISHVMQVSFFFFFLSPPAVKTQCLELFLCQAFQRLVESSPTLVN